MKEAKKLPPIVRLRGDDYDALRTISRTRDVPQLVHEALVEGVEALRGRWRAEREALSFEAGLLEAYSRRLLAELHFSPGEAGLVAESLIDAKVWGARILDYRLLVSEIGCGIDTNGQAPKWDVDGVTFRQRIRLWRNPEALAIVSGVVRLWALSDEPTDEALIKSGLLVGKPEKEAKP